MHSNDVMTKNTLNFLNKPNELSGKMAIDMKDEAMLLIKQESLLGIKTSVESHR